MAKRHLSARGLNFNEIRKKIDDAHPDAILQRLGGDEQAEEEQWEIGQQLKIYWRIPQDVQRVMLFERLQYMCLEKSDSKEQQQAQSELINNIKQLYFKKLESLK